jgi:cell division protein FtsL
MIAKIEAVLLTIVLVTALVVIFFDLSYWRP